MKQFLVEYGLYVVTAVQALTAAIAWWFSKNVATKEEVNEVVQRIEALEAARQNAPDKDDLAALSLEIANVRGDMRAFRAEIQGARQTVTAEVEGLHRLVDRVEGMATTLTQHLLSRGQ